MSFDTFLYGSQGTMGVVTWGVVEIEPIPTMSKAFFINSARVQDIIEPLYVLLRRGVCNECLVLNNIDLATILTENWPLQFAEIRSILPAWTVILISAALKRRPEEKMAYQEDFMRETIAGSFNRLQLLTTLAGLPAVEKKLPEMLRKPWPKNRTYWKHAFKGGCQDLTFMTTLDRVETFIPAINAAAAENRYPISDVGCYIQPVEDGHACQLQFSFYYSPLDKDEVERTHRLYRQAGAAALAKGAYFTRPYPMLADLVYRNNGDYVALLKRFKKHFDPNAILNPGNLCF
jgi:hypothetical protein